MKPQRLAHQFVRTTALPLLASIANNANWISDDALNLSPPAAFTVTPLDGFSLSVDPEIASEKEQTIVNVTLTAASAEITITDYPAPTAQTGVVVAGSHCSLFLQRNGGQVWATGQNTYGQLGDGTTESRSNPFQGMSGIVAASAGFGHSLFLKTDGTAWATGWNEAGQLGDGSTVNRLVPVQVLTSVSSISAGAEHSLFLKTDSTVWGTGSSASGEMGEETAAPQVSTPFMLLTWAWNLYEADGDGDGLADVVEINATLSDPLDPDTDGDGLSDGQEVLTFKTDPFMQDTSGDGLTDGETVADGLDPLFDHSGLIARVVADPLRFGLDPEPWRAEGRDAVLNDPASFDLYSLEQIADLRPGCAMIGIVGD